jgi:DNA polymerase III alpha subunit (gram-positive type)
VSDPIEIYISVDIETAGPNPGNYSLLAIGACTIFLPEDDFYVEIKPVNNEFTTEALESSQLDLAKLRVRGLTPQNAMYSFSQWIQDVTPAGNQPVFVALNAPHDWMFVNEYFHRYLGKNPFGYEALDINAFYMGISGVPWSQTGFRYIVSRYPGKLVLSHHALQDAQDQAIIFRKLLEESLKRSSSARG